MKRITLFTALSFVLIFTGFIFLNTGIEIHNTSLQNYSPPAPVNNRFYFGAMDSWGDERYNGNYNNYDAIGYNTWHTYLRDEYQLPDRKTPVTNIVPGIHDGLFNDVSTYADALKYKIDQLNTHNNTTVLWMRPKIEWLLYGQSSIYQCEFTGLDTNYWFYAFNSNSTQNPHTGEDFRDNTVYGSGAMVKRCLVSADEEGWVVDRLRANTEQCNRGPHWSQDSKCDWYLKPRIRIDSTVADDPLNFNTPVCSLKVIDKDGNLKTTKILKVINFIDENLNYDGRYIEEFYNLAINDSLKFNGDLGDRWLFDARGYTTGAEELLLGNHADIQVFWYGHFDMYIDYVKVENDIANKLFKGENDDWIRDEVNLISNASTTQAVFKYYMELFEFNNIPAMAYVNHKIDSLSFGKTGLMADFTNYMFNHLHYGWGGGVQNQHLFSYTPQYVYNNIVNKIGLKHFFFETYPLTSSYEHNVSSSAQTWSRIPISLPRSTGDSILAWHVPPEEYDFWLQSHLDAGYTMPGIFTRTIYGGEDDPGCTSTSGEDAGAYRYYMKLASALSKDYGVPFINMPQGHQWFWPTEVRREPTNEEMDMLANIAVSYGSKGLIYFYYPTEQFTPIPCVRYGVGMEEQNHTLRKHNVYHQAKYKWEVVRDIGLRMNSWKQKLLSFDDAQTKSYVYRLADERNVMYQNEYFYDIYTFKPGSEPFQCVEDFPEGIVPPVNTIGECKQDRYLQVATFENPNELYTNYFMLVNRRCSPHRPEISENGGYRQIQVYFNQYANQLERYDNWKITDVENPATVITYVKGQTLLDFGWFEPGEGKLYKMEPIMRSGGILAGDENISGESFTCEAPVYNNGHNITIGANTTIHFTDSAKFVMDGGVFTVGDQNISAPQNITSDAVTGSSWSGHIFTNCEVKIYGATFTGLTNDTTYAVNIIDCPVVDIRNCTFNTNSSLKGGVNAVFFSDPNNEITLSNIYIGANTFNSSGSTIPTVNISSYAGETTPLIIENNTFNEGNTAIFLSGITGGAIKGNSITDNFIGINALTSAIDIKSNTISSTINSAIGIFVAGSSELKMNNAGSKSLGGLNDLSNSGTTANNIVVDGSVFLLDGGQNIFNITDDQSSKHLYGYFPQFTQGPFDETNNCFKLNSTPIDPPYNMVTSGFQGSQITFNFTPYLTGCEANDGGDGFAINLGDGIYDTIYSEGSGSGGSHSSRLPLAKGEYPQGEGVYYTLPTAKQRYDSISVLMRYRSYSQARTKCLDLINTYPDSIQSLNAISKLFLSTVASDTSYNAVNELKIYYEDLILNHGYNTSLVKRANYYILKCKVRMREYSQALAGFQQIINQNPYSYEGLIARWDYMATSLLIQGQGGAFSSIDNEQLTMNNYDLDGNDDDRSPFTKEQRQDIRKSINTAIEISKDEDDRKIKTLEVKSEHGDVNASKELEHIRSLKQVVKTEKPKSIIEHVRIVSEDIRKVFGSNTSGKGNEPKNIPMVFKLSQNYPNPFNPVTRINYDLPKDSKVKIVIYDILGREVKRLVNNELKTAGFYIVDFNASNYASGVYFYRIEAEEPNGNKFVDSKKMVLLK